MMFKEALSLTFRFNRTDKRHYNVRSCSSWF